MYRKNFLQFAFLAAIVSVSLAAFSQPLKDTVSSLKYNGIKKVIYKAPSGKQYKVQFWDDPFSSGISTASAQCGEDDFKGKARKGPKTSLVKSASNSVGSVRQLIASLPDDKTMIGKLKSLPKPQLNKRQPEENRNVRLATGIFLYAIKREDDNDYHVIIGDSKNFKTAVFLNVEVSGIALTDKTNLQKVRDFFEENFVDVCGNKYAVFIENPIPISVEGSLFYDIDHKPGQIGPGNLKSKTSWEIHPVLKIAAKD